MSSDAPREQGGEPVAPRPRHPLEAAWAAADTAARGSRVEIRAIDDIEVLHDVQRLYERVWRTGPTGTPVTADMLRAMAKAGSYVSGAFDGDALVGACFGFFGPPTRRALHSHIAGVDDRMRGRSVGFAMKLHQRAWAMQRGAEDVTWTFDPLIRRNAYFNLRKLAATAEEYLPSFYGPMDDDINRSDDTDRVLIRWRLASLDVVSACGGPGAPRHDAARSAAEPAARVSGARPALEPSLSGRPIAHPLRGGTVLVGVPADIEAMRLEDPRCAGDWRIALRDTLGSLMADGARVRGFDRAGWYIVDRQDDR